MATVNIENTAISEVVGTDESLTVPAGEVWNVTILARPAVRTSDGTTSRYVRINGAVMWSSRSYMRGTSGNGRAGEAHTSFPVRTTLVGGDTITCDSTAVHISGFVVSS